MTIEEAREYWSRRLERAAGYSDEHWDAEERHAHKEYIDALKHAITALAIYREREEAAKPKTNGDKIRSMTDEELEHEIIRIICDKIERCKNDITCYDCRLQWLKQEVSEDAGTD